MKTALPIVTLAMVAWGCPENPTFEMRSGAAGEGLGGCFALLGDRSSACVADDETQRLYCDADGALAFETCAPGSCCRPSDQGAECTDCNAGSDVPVPGEDLGGGDADGDADVPGPDPGGEASGGGEGDAAGGEGEGEAAGAGGDADGDADAPVQDPGGEGEGEGEPAGDPGAGDPQPVCDDAATPSWCEGTWLGWCQGGQYQYYDCAQDPARPSCDWNGAYYDCI